MFIRGSLSSSALVKVVENRMFGNRILVISERFLLANLADSLIGNLEVSLFVISYSKNVYLSQTENN